MLFSENINCLIRDHERNRQTGLLWQYRAMRYSALLSKSDSQWRCESTQSSL